MVRRVLTELLVLVAHRETSSAHTPQALQQQAQQWSSSALQLRVSGAALHLGLGSTHQTSRPQRVTANQFTFPPLHPQGGPLGEIVEGLKRQQLLSSVEQHT